MYKVYISPSMQKENISALGYSEKALQAAIAQELMKLCNENPLLQVASSYGHDWDLQMVCHDSNKFMQDADLTKCIHICLHSDAGGGSGQTVFYNSQQGKLLAESIYNELALINPFGKRGVSQWSGLYELKHTIATACLIEIAFHDIMKEANWIYENPALIASGYYKGICKYFGIEPKPQHWGQQYFDFLNSIGMNIQETRFDDGITRAEIFVILTKLYKIMKG